MDGMGLNLCCGNCGRVWLQEVPQGWPNPDAILTVACPHCAKLMEAHHVERTPPWVIDGDLELWYTLRDAARYYFRKSPEYVSRSIRLGDYKNIFPTYMDGSRWWIKLPTPLKVPHHEPDRNSSVD